MLFIMTECKKKTKSWFWPYFKSIQKIEDLSDYDPTYIKETEDTTQNKYVKSHDESSMSYWKDFETIGNAYYRNPDYFSIDVVKYSWKVLQTRSFGYSQVPSTSLIPIMDLFNHGIEEKLVLAVWPKSIELEMIKRSILESKNEPEENQKFTREPDVIKNGDEHYDDVDITYNHLNSTVSPKSNESNLTGKAVPKLESIWDPENTNIALEIRSQKENP